jgi:hypothetical protein
VGGVTWGKPGAVGPAPAERAFKGNALDAYMTVPNVPATNVFSVEVWARSGGATWNQNGWIASARVANGWVVHPNGTAASVGFYVINSDGTTYTQIGAGATVTNPQNWHHYVFTWNGSSGRAYIDGVQVIADIPAAVTRTSGGTWPVYFGYDANLAGRFGDGWIDEAAIYNVALDGATVANHYQASFRRVSVTGASAGSTSVNAVLRRARPLVAAAAGATTVAAALSVSRRLVATAPGTSTVSVQLTRYRALAATAAGLTTVTSAFGTPGDAYGAAVYNEPSNIAYWRLGEMSGTTARDSSKSGGHHATYVGAPQLNQPGGITYPGDGAPNFSGTGQYVDIPDFAITGSFTVECWFKADAWTGGSFCLVNRRTVGNVGGFSLEINSGQPFFHVYGATWASISNANRTLALGVWHHVVGVYHSGGSGLLMINGEDCGRTGAFGTMNNPAGPLLRIGYNNAGGQCADGQIDEVAIYNTNLPDATIQNHYKLGVEARSIYGQAVERTPGLVARWTFEEAANPFIWDHTGAGHTLVLSGTVTTWGSGIGGSYTGVGSGDMRYFQAAGSGMGLAAAIPLNVYSIECWFYPIGLQPAGAGSAPCIIADMYGTPSNINYALWMDGNSLILRGAMHNDGVGWAATTGTYTLTDQTWHHIVLSYDGATLRLYVNGTERGNAACTGYYPSPGLGLRVGRRWDLADYINGIVDEIGIYNRALTLTEIREHWTKGFGNVWKVDLVGTAAGRAVANARSPKAPPLLTFTDDFEDGVITPDKWIVYATGLTAEQSSRPWGVRP